MKSRTDTATLISALRILSQDIQSDDGVANAAILEASWRLQELENTKNTLVSALAESNKDLISVSRKYKRELNLYVKSCQAVSTLVTERVTGNQTILESIKKENHERTDP